MARSFLSQGWKVERHRVLPLGYDRDKALRKGWEHKKPDLVLVWNGLLGRRKRVSQTAQALDIPCLHFELAPFPGYLQADPVGVNAGSMLAKQWPGKWNRQVSMTSLRSGLVARQPKRGSKVIADSLPSRYIFAPLQVAKDTQLSHYGGWVSNVDMFLDTLQAVQTDVPFVVKPHPSDKQRKLWADSARSRGIIVAADDHNPYQLIEGAEAIVTVNSGLGLEALLFDIPVLVLGHAIYAQPEIAQPINDIKSLKSALQSPLHHSAEKRAEYLAFLQDEVFVPINLSKPDISERLIDKLIKRVEAGIRLYGIRL